VYNVIGMLSRAGFTLVELMVSVGILAILSAGVLALIGQGPRQYSRDVRRQTDLEQIRSAIELYRSDNTSYPPCSPAATGCQINTTNVPALTSSYILAIPTDPYGTAGRMYMYRPFDSASGTCSGTTADPCVTYSLCAALERTTTSVVGSPACAAAGCGATCSYRVVNP